MAFPWSVSAMIPLLTMDQKMHFLQNAPVVAIRQVTCATHIDIDGHDHWYVSFQKGKKDGVTKCIKANVCKEPGCQANAIDMPMVLDRMVELFNKSYPNESPTPETPKHCISMSYSGFFVLGPAKFNSTLQGLKEFIQLHASYPQGGCVLLYFLSES